MKPITQQQQSASIQRHSSTLGNNNTMQQKPLININPNMMQPVFYMTAPVSQPTMAPTPFMQPQIPMFTSPGQYNLTMPPMMAMQQQQPQPQQQYSFANSNTNLNQPAPIYYYQMPSTSSTSSLMPRSTPIFIPTLNTNRSFVNTVPELRPPPMPIDSKPYEPPKITPLALPPPPTLPLRMPSELTDTSKPVQIYKLQKPVIVVDSLKHPSDKYKDLIYKPKYLTSRNINPPTDELVPKWNENDELAPLPNFSTRNPSKINIDIHLRYPSLNSNRSLTDNFKLTSRNPTLVNDLKLPYSRPESKEPTLVGDLKLPIEKV